MKEENNHTFNEITPTHGYPIYIYIYIVFHRTLADLEKIPESTGFDAHITYSGHVYLHMMM